MEKPQAPCWRHSASVAFHGGERGLVERPEAVAGMRDAQAAVAHLRGDGGEARGALDFGDVVARGRPAPVVAAAEDAVGEFVQPVRLLRHGVGREAAVAHHLRGHALARFFGAVLERLQVRVAVRVDEAGRDNQAGAVDNLGLGGRGKAAGFGDVVVQDEHVAGGARGPRAVDQNSVAQPDAVHGTMISSGLRKFIVYWARPEYSRWTSKPAAAARRRTVGRRW